MNSTKPLEVIRCNLACRHSSVDALADVRYTSWQYCHAQGQLFRSRCA